MKRRETTIQIISVSFILLWSYAAFSKLADLDKSRSEMLNQVFPLWVADVLYWLIPAIELGLCILLMIRKTRFIGLVGSWLLISSFSIYIAVTMTGAFGRIPCSCGGILSQMSYGAHLVFNLFFVLLASLAIALSKRRDNEFTFFHFKRKEIARHSE